jgi:two-component system invasion response regulator UvrY
LKIKKGFSLMQSIKVVVVSAHDLVRSGVHQIVQAAPAIESIQLFVTIHECEQYLKQHRAQVLLLDDVLPRPLLPIQIMTAMHELQPTLRIIVFSDHLSEFYVQRLIDNGAAGFIYKQDRLEDTLVAGIKTVADGHIFLSPQASALPYGRSTDGNLNRTDMEVLQMMAQGYTVQEISARIGIVDRTVYRIRGKLRQYLGVRTNEQVVEAALRKGLLNTRPRTGTD